MLDDAQLPYCMVPGNDDYGVNGGAADRTTLLSKHFPAAMQAKRPGWGGVYDKEPDRVDNNFQFVETKGRKFLVVGLEFGPRKDVVRWVNEIARWLRLVEMRPDGSAQAYDYSPTRGQRNESPQNRFTFGISAIGS